MQAYNDANAKAEGYGAEIAWLSVAENACKQAR